MLVRKDSYRSSNRHGTNVKQRGYLDMYRGIHMRGEHEDVTGTRHHVSFQIVDSNHILLMHSEM
jgi:hypothetical protein